MEKDLLIHRVGLVPLPINHSCPTVLYYSQDGQTLCGELANQAAEEAQCIPDLNHDFKVALGAQSSRSSTADFYPCADNQSRSAFKLTSDFLRFCLKQASERLTSRGQHDAAHLMIAEPVSVHSEENGNWLADYRKNLRDLLRDKEFKDIPHILFTDVEFLPEPLAVFNYYRYGFRHPNLAGQEKYRVLVLDVGGGTSDCSVIETTREGEVSKSGRNSKPFGASSETIGGHFVNYKLAEFLMLNYVAKGKTKSELRQGLKRMISFIRGNKNSIHFKQEEWNLYSNLEWVLYYVEIAKKELSRFIADHICGWSNEAPPAKEVFIHLPRDPFRPTNDTEWFDAPLSTGDFKKVVENEIWKPYLKPLVLRTLENASQALDGKPINRVILSGGTANIGWIGQWLGKDLPQLEKAMVIDIKADYQEVVAQGLAIECTRRFFSDTHVSDFQSVTYNPLSLRVGFAGEGVKPYPWRPVSSTLPDQSGDGSGTLIGSATRLDNLCGKSLEWKLAAHTHAPKAIEYYFYAASGRELSDFRTDHNELERARLNFEEFKVDAPSNAKFDSSLKLHLELSEDGTARGQFLLRDGQHATDLEKLPIRPFHIDMTASRQSTEVAGKVYVGLDFGSSNTAMAMVSAFEIEQYSKDSKDSRWLELTELAEKLPYPVAHPLALYFAESGDVIARAKRARQMIETALSLLLSVAMADHQKAKMDKHGGAKHGPLKCFANSKVSAGPLWACLRTYIDLIGSTASFSKPMRELLGDSVIQIVNQAVDAVAGCKHDKVDEASVEWNRPLCVLGNVVRQVFEKTEFGYFSNCSKRAGKAIANFRKLHGTGYGDSGRQMELSGIPEDAQPYLFSPEDSLVIPLFPWILLENGADSSRRICLFFDGVEKSGNLGYRAPTMPGEKVLENIPDLSGYSDSARKLLEGKFEAELIRILSISEES